MPEGPEKDYSGITLMIDKCVDYTDDSNNCANYEEIDEYIKTIRV